jgi:EF-hand domain pair
MISHKTWSLLSGKLFESLFDFFLPISVVFLLDRVFDRDSNGYITLDELQRAMQLIGEIVTDAQLNEMLALADLDKDGKINYEGD